MKDLNNQTESMTKEEIIAEYVKSFLSLPSDNPEERKDEPFWGS